jgi:hypothetical protein
VPNIPPQSDQIAAVQMTDSANQNVAELAALSGAPQIFSPTVVETALAITAGLVAQLLVPGSFLAGMLTSLPAWKWFDPVPIISSPNKKNASKHIRRSKGTSKDVPQLGDLLA